MNMKIKCGFNKEFKVWTVSIFRDEELTEIYAHESLLKCLQYVEGIK